MPAPAPAQTTTARRADGSPWRWRRYHGVAFYLLVQLLTFGLSGLTGALRGTTGKSARERVFGDVSYFRSLKQSVFAPPPGPSVQRGRSTTPRLSGARCAS